MSIPHLVWVHDGMVVKKSQNCKNCETHENWKNCEKMTKWKKISSQKALGRISWFFQGFTTKLTGYFEWNFFSSRRWNYNEKKIKQTCNFNYDALLIFAWTYFSKSNEIRKYEEKTLINVLFNSFQTVSRSFSSFLNILELLELGVNFW